MISRQHWNTSFSAEAIPPWRCPTCSNGVVRQSADAWRSTQTKASRDGWELDHWEPDWTKERITAMLECGSCGEAVAMVATGFMVEADHFDPDYHGPQFIPRFWPLFFDPPLPIFQAPASSPSSVTKCLTSSFSAYWAMPNAAGNEVRKAIEFLLDEHQIPRTIPVPGKGKPRTDLHARIEEFGKQQPDAAQFLLAVKLLGNSGSHGHELTHDDVLDAYTILERVLVTLYDPTNTPEHLAKTINQSKKPIGPR